MSICGERSRHKNCVDGRTTAGRPENTLPPPAIVGGGIKTTKRQTPMSVQHHVYDDVDDVEDDTVICI